MTQCEIVWGAQAFWARARQDVALASRRLFVQAMTFEGDAAGLAVASAIAASRAPDRRVLVDAYTRHVVSDRFVWTPAALADPALRAEVRSTRAMFADLSRQGVQVRMTNPVGVCFRWFPARNHKKLILADDVAYIGGVNFSDHNFGWTDFMVRLEGADAARFLATDFEATFEGRPRADRVDLGDTRLFSLDGRSNAAAFGKIAALIEDARGEVTVVSPYVTFPLTRSLARLRTRGVTVRLVTPRSNNKPAAQRYILAESARRGFEVRFAPAMSHVKAIVIDQKRLIAGSSNFDFVSIAAEEELVAVLDKPDVATTFLGYLDATLEGAAPADISELAPGAWGTRALLGVAAFAAHLARGSRRGVRPWPGKDASSGDQAAARAGR